MKRTLLLFALFLSLGLYSLGAAVRVGDVRIISYNIRLSTGNDGANVWSARKQASLRMVRTEYPTIFGLQEALADQVEFLLDSLPDYRMVGVGRDDGLERGEQMAIFYRDDEVELLQWGTFWLSDTPAVPSFGWDAACRRTCTWAKFRHRASGERFAVLNTHLDHKGPVAQVRGLRRVVEQCKRLIPPGMPVFLTGDMNITPDAAPLAMLTPYFEDGRQVARLSDPRGTFNRWGRADRIIDYIFVRGVTALRYAVLRDDNYGAPFISDHYPIALDASFSEPSAPAPTYNEKLPFRSKENSEFLRRMDENWIRQIMISDSLLSETDPEKIAEYERRERELEREFYELVAEEKVKDSLVKQRGRGVWAHPVGENLYDEECLAAARELLRGVDAKSYDTLLDCLSCVSLPEGARFGVEPYEENGFGDTCKPYVELADGQREYILFNQLSIEKSARGAWQAFLLDRLINVLPLYWHSNYMEMEHVFDEEDFMQLKNIYSEPVHTLTKDLTFDLQPRIYCSGEAYYVYSCSWSNFGGLTRICTEVVFRGNKVTDINSFGLENLYKYRCGIMF